MEYSDSILFSYYFPEILHYDIKYSDISHIS